MEHGSDLGLGLKEYNILSGFSLYTFAFKDNELSICALGLLDKITSAAPITASDIEVRDDGKVKMRSSFKARGKAGIWVSGISTAAASNFSVTLHNKAVKPEFLQISVGIPGHDRAQIIEVDILGAWSEMALWEDGHKEVDLEIVIG